MPGFKAFPQELINLIIEEISPDEWPYYNNTREYQKTLQNCAQVSRAFRYQARKNLFAEVRVIAASVNGAESKQAKNLVLLLENDTDLARLIRGLTFVIDAGIDMQKEPSQADDIHAEVLLGMLPEIRKIGIDTCRGNCEHGWAAFSESLRSALWDLHKRPLLQTLELGPGILAPVDFISRWTNLKHLKLSTADFTLTSSGPYHVQEQKLAQVESLSFWFVGRGCQLDLRSPTLFQYLRRFCGIFEVGNFAVGRDAWPIIERASPHLEEIILHNFWSSDKSKDGRWFTNLERPEFLSLKALTIRESRLKLESDVSSISNLIRFALFFLSSTKFESLSLDLTWEFHKDRYDKDRFYEEEYLDAGAWADLDRILSFTPSFRHLNIRIIFIIYIEDDRFGTKRTRGIPLQRIFDQWTPRNTFPLVSSNNGVTINLSAFLR